MKQSKKFLTRGFLVLISLIAIFFCITQSITITKNTLKNTNTKKITIKTQKFAEKISYIKKVEDNTFKGKILNVIYPYQTTSEEKLFLTCLEHATQDTFYFRIIDHIAILNEKRCMFYKKDPLSLKQLARHCNSGQKIRIPSSKSLNTFSEIFIGFIYLNNEKIKNLDF